MYPAKVTPRHMIVIVVMSLLAACTPEQNAPAGHAQASDAARWQVDTIPFLRIGVDGSAATEFSHVVGLGKLSTGDWYVFDRGSNELRFYDHHGTFLKKIGRQGNGPGEFRYVLLAVARSDDHIYVYDSVLRRLTQVDPEGHVIDVTRVPDQPPQSSVLHPLGILDDQTFVWSSSKTPACALDALLMDTITYYQYDISRKPRRSSDPASPTDLVLITSTAGGARWGNSINVLGTCLATAVPFGAKPLAAVRDGNLYLLAAEELLIRVLHVASSREVAISEAVAKLPVSPEMREWIATLSPSNTRDEAGNALAASVGSELYAKRLRETPLPDSMPLARQLVADAAGYIWVELTPPAASSVSTWLVFAPGGQHAARVHLPNRFRALSIGHEYVAGVRLDDLDVERIEVYSLSRSAEPSNAR